MINPYPGLILIEPQEHTKLDNWAQADPEEGAPAKTKVGKVLRIGTTYQNQYNTYIKSWVNVGDVIVHRQYGPESFTVNGKNYTMIRFEDVLGWVEEDNENN